MSAAGTARSLCEDSAGGAGNTPLSNTGGIPSDHFLYCEDLEFLETDGEELWIKCRQRQSRGLIHIDWLSFTVHCGPTRVWGVASQIAARLKKLVGGEVHEGKGGHFYSWSHQVRSEETLLAVVYFGGETQRSTVHVSIPAAFFLSTDDAVRQELYDLLTHYEVDHIARIDLCRDCFEDESSFEQMQQAYQEGQFKPCRGVTPSSWWIRDVRRGSTFHVGRRENGKLVRGYEKSMQLARKQGWFRVELELRSVNRRIPLDVLLRPAEFFAGACEYLRKLADGAETARVKTFRNTVQMSVEHHLHYARLGYGKFLTLLKRASLNDEQILRLMTEGVRGVPRRLRLSSFDRLTKSIGLAPPMGLTCGAT
jgi:phage replication initiation protein